MAPPAYLFWTRISVGFLLYHEDGNSVFLRNVDKLQVYTTSHPRKLSVCDMSWRVRETDPPFSITPLKVASTQTSRHDFRLPPRNGYEPRSSGGYYAASSDNFFFVSWTLKVRPTGCSEMSVGNQLHALRSNKEKRNSQTDEYLCIYVDAFASTGAVRW
jgi:hypothetical protein